MTEQSPAPPPAPLETQRQRIKRYLLNHGKWVALGVAACQLLDLLLL